jgi:hypothetical protein
MMAQTRSMVREATMAAGMYFVLSEWMPMRRRSWLMMVYLGWRVIYSFSAEPYYGPGFGMGDYLESHGGGRPDVRPIQHIYNPTYGGAGLFGLWGF